MDGSDYDKIVDNSGNYYLFMYDSVGSMAERQLSWHYLHSKNTSYTQMLYSNNSGRTKRRRSLKEDGGHDSFCG